MFGCVLLLLVNCLIVHGTTNVLILGGDGMMGSATVRKFLQSNKEYFQFNLTLINRGYWYWDTEETIKPFVRFLQCTRGDGFRELCKGIYDGLTYDTIIDFSCYHPLDMEDILIAFRGRFKRYIYISSDSVYEVSKQQSNKNYSVEEDAVRPDDIKLQNELNKKDGYGHRKLQGEETIRKYHKPLKYQYISLRLPDVIGSRDNTNRFWKCLLWIKLNSIIGPIKVPSHLERTPLSFVYSEDVAEMIFHIVSNPTNDIWNNEYNLAFQETVTLKSFLKMIGSFVNENQIEFTEGYFKIPFPSVTRGPVNINKAVKKLGWSPIPLEEAIKETVKFYNDAQFNHTYKYILERVLEFFEILGDKYRDFVALHHAELEKRSLKDEL